MSGKGTNIILIGFMGSGKSSVGMKLARALDYEFMDTDVMIEKQYGMSIANIFAEKGEAAFRQMETEVLKEIVKSVKNTVIATGGGMPMREENAALIKQAGLVIFLKASKETILSRVEGDTARPMLSGSKEKMEELLNSRIPRYEELADGAVVTDRHSFYEIIREIEGIFVEKERGLIYERK